MEKKTDAELMEWAAEQRRDYHAGKLTRRQIQKLEEIHGWTWGDKPLADDWKTVLRVAELRRVFVRKHPTRSPKEIDELAEFVMGLDAKKPQRFPVTPLPDK